MTDPIPRARARAAAIGVLIALCVSGCGTGSSPHDSLLPEAVPTHVRLLAATVPGLGPVLTDQAGRTLYIFPPDAKQAVTCTGPCAGTWPAFTVARGARPAAGPGPHPALIGVRPDPNSGADAVTYAGYPLYRYAGDTGSGTANGQDLFVNGGPWFVLRPDGQPDTAPPSPGSR